MVVFLSTDATLEHKSAFSIAIAVTIPPMSYLPNHRPTPDSSHEGYSSQDQGPKKRKKEPDTLSIQERKCSFINNPTEKVKEKMAKDVADIEVLFGASLPGGDCWLHPWPPESEDGKPPGLIKCYYNCNDATGHHRLHINYGIVSLIVNHDLTEQQKRGFIDSSWQLSHLGGNWTCCNWKHFTVESMHQCHSKWLLRCRVRMSAFTAVYQGEEA